MAREGLHFSTFKRAVLVGTIQVIPCGKVDIEVRVGRLRVKVVKDGRAIRGARLIPYTALRDE